MLGAQARGLRSQHGKAHEGLPHAAPVHTEVLMAEPRAPFSAIVDRPPLKLPDGARVAVWVCINVEEWEFGAPMARALLPAPQGVSVTPDVPNYSWYDYGMRVGFWRFKEVLDRHGIKATVSL